jgi:hypothetical protein
MKSCLPKESTPLGSLFQHDFSWHRLQKLSLDVEVVVCIYTTVPQKHSHQFLEGLGLASKYTTVDRYESKAEPSHCGVLYCTWRLSQNRPEFEASSMHEQLARKRSNCRARDGHATPSDGSTHFYWVCLLRGTALYMLTISHI